MKKLILVAVVFLNLAPIAFGADSKETHAADSASKVESANPAGKTADRKASKSEVSTDLSKKNDACGTRPSATITK